MGEGEKREPPEKMGRICGRRPSSSSSKAVALTSVGSQTSFEAQTSFLLLGSFFYSCCINLFSYIFSRNPSDFVIYDWHLKSV